MKSFFSKEMLKTLLFGGILALISFLVFHYVVPEHYFNAFPFLLLLFILYSIFSHIFLDQSDTLRPQALLNRYLFVTSAKLFLLLMVVVFYVVVIREKAAAFLISLLIIYFIFLIFDISTLLGKSRTSNQKKN